MNLPNRYTAIERLDGMIASLDELEFQLFPGIGESDNFQHIRDTVQEMRAEQQAKFPNIEEYKGETPEYACALAEFLGLGGHSDIHTVDRKDVIRVARTLYAYGRDTGHLMCQEYGDDEDYCGIYWADIEQWIRDWREENDRWPNPTGEDRVIDLDWCVEHSDEIIPEEYETFEIM